MRVIMIVAVICGILWQGGWALAQTRPALVGLPGEQIEQVLQLRGKFNERGNVLALKWARDDVRGGVESRVAFQVGKRKPAIVMGEMALLAHEVNPALAALVAGDVSVTSLRAAALDDEPRVSYLNFDGEGDAILLATAVRKAMDAVKAARPVDRAARAPGSSANATSAATLDEIFGKKGTAIAGAYELEIPHSVEMPCGCLVGKDMGVRTLLKFTGTDQQARVDGEIACIVGQLQPALKALSQGGITITSIANHMELEAPRTIFVHVTATGPAADLAKAIKPALRFLPQERDPEGHQHHGQHEH